MGVFRDRWGYGKKKRPIPDAGDAAEGSHAEEIIAMVRGLRAFFRNGFTDLENAHLGRAPLAELETASWVILKKQLSTDLRSTLEDLPKETKLMLSGARVQGRPTAIITCNTDEAKDAVQHDLKKCGALGHAQKMNFSIEVTHRFLASTSTTGGDFGQITRNSTSSTIGAELAIQPPTESGHLKASVTTIGGVINVGDKLYGLTSAHGIYEEWHLGLMQKGKEVKTLARISSPESALVTSSSGGKSQQFSAKVAQYRFSTHGRNGLEYVDDDVPAASDWELVELGSSQPLLNAIALSSASGSRSIEEALWTDSRGIDTSGLSGSGDGDPVALFYHIQEVVRGADLIIDLAAHHTAPDTPYPRMPCLIALRSRLVPGLLHLEPAIFEAYEVGFDVFRVDILDPLVPGDSGSWVLVGDRLFGMVIGAEMGHEAAYAYVLPMEAVFRSIEATTSRKASLPSVLDLRLMNLRAKRPLETSRLPIGRRENDVWLQRYLNIELILAHQQQDKRKANRIKEAMTLPSTIGVSTLTWPAVPRMGTLSRFLLEDVTGLQAATLDLVLLLGDVCPLSPALRGGLRTWLPKHRHSRFRHRRAFISSIVLRKYTATEAGENVLGLILIHWKTQREEFSGAGRRSDPEKIYQRQIVWLAELLSSLFVCLQTPASAIPSTQQLRLFVRCIVAAFKNKDLSELQFILDSNDLDEDASPMDEHWTVTPPTPLGIVSTAWLWVREWFSNSEEEESLYNIDTALQAVQPTTWDHSVVFTCRVLVQLRQLMACDGQTSRILVCAGDSAAWVGFYAAVVLGIDVEFRLRCSDAADGSVPMLSPYKRPTEQNDSPVAGSYVLVYLDEYYERRKESHRGSSHTSRWRPGIETSKSASTTYTAKPPVTVGITKATPGTETLKPPPATDTSKATPISAAICEIVSGDSFEPLPSYFRSDRNGTWIPGSRKRKEFSSVSDMSPAVAMGDI